MNLLIAKLVCHFYKHRPDKVHGYGDLPDWGTTCTRCGYQYETQKEYEKRCQL